MNNHVGTALLRDRLLAAAAQLDADAEVVDRLEVASWVPLPTPGDRSEAAWFGAEHDVVILDCLDEMISPATPAEAEVLRNGRWLREMARRTNTAVVITARVGRPVSLGLRSHTAAWRGHWMRALFDDIPDVRVNPWRDESGESAFAASVRGRGNVSGVLQHPWIGRLCAE